MKLALTLTWVATQGTANKQSSFHRRAADTRGGALFAFCEQFVNFYTQNYEPFISILLPVKAVV